MKCYVEWGHRGGANTSITMPTLVSGAQLCAALAHVQFSGKEDKTLKLKEWGKFASLGNTASWLAELNADGNRFAVVSDCFYVAITKEGWQRGNAAAMLWPLDMPGGFSMKLLGNEPQSFESLQQAVLRLRGRLGRVDSWARQF